MKKLLIILCLLFLYTSIFGVQGYYPKFGVKADLGLNPYLTLGGYIEIDKIFFDINYSYNGKISGAGSGTLSSSTSPIFYSTVGYIYKIPNEEKIEIIAAAGAFLQHFSAKVNSSCLEYSQFGSEANADFLNFMIVGGIRYKYQNNIYFTGKANYYLSKGEETFWFEYPGGAKSGATITSLNGIGFTAGVIYYF